MKASQLRAWKYENVIEWIPFDRLSDVKEIGKGGFGSVYSATWLDGIRKVDKIKDGDNDIYERTRKPSSTVALKTLASSMENQNDFLKELKSLMKCTLNFDDMLEIYGITQNTQANEYLMVFQYANDGSLYKYLRKNFSTLTWKIKLQILNDISDKLDSIHYCAYIHADFHSGNILQDQESYIAVLGLSKKNDENDSEDNIYGVMPYVAPEVLLGLKFTRAVDIYGLGVIMSEISTGQRPLDGHEFDTKLAVKICKGLRPEFAFGTLNAISN
ncbi:kinase-like domain-containing protein [Gigaspora rosea]|uniref:Kinase-like domain-containing protein n=1 Tax=Gigaspora rosea TaxID=44941 RepID=A0A397TWA1_9GLOM|nr:kinase-like domain-containing protein [Gigaspora rosea]